jgi:hypothetical protein
MRDLALKVMAGGRDVGIEVPESNSNFICVPYACELVSVAVHLNTPATTIHSWNLLVNSVDSTIDFVVPSGFKNGVIYPRSRAFLDPADRINLQSNGETGTAGTNAYITYVFKPLSPRPASEVWLPGESLSDVTSETVSTTKCAPFACEVIGVAFRTEAAIDADTLMTMVIDNVTTTTKVLLPNGSVSGFYQPDAELYVKEGGSIRSKSDAATTTGGYVMTSYVCQPDGPAHPAGWVYVSIQGGSDIGTPGSSDNTVSPVNGRVRGIVVNATAPVDVLTNFALDVGGVVPPGAPNCKLPTTTEDDSGLFMPIDNVHDFFVLAGEIVNVTSGGEMQSADGSTMGIWIEPLEGIQ